MKFARLSSDLWLWVILLATCGLPVGWTLLTVARYPAAIVAGLSNSHILQLCAKTVGLSLASAVGAIILGALPAVAMGRGTSPVARALWLITPLPLLLPSLVLTYGWSELLSRLHMVPFPQSTADVVRCVATLSAWLWPIPAVMIATVLRRVDRSLLDQATLDGVRGRLLLRRALPPMVAAGAVCMILAFQEFAIFEATAISVVATELRMIFTTGTLSSTANPMAVLVGGVGAPSVERLGPRSALALSAGSPLIVLTLLLFALFRLLAPSPSADDSANEPIEVGPPARAAGHYPRGGRLLSAIFHGRAVTLGAWVVVLALVGGPLITMLLSLNRPFRPLAIYAEYQPQIVTGLQLAGAAGAVGFGLAVLAAVRLPRGAMTLAIVAFLIGGQFTAIALLELFDTDWGVEHVLDTNVAAAVAYVSRFAWIALVASAFLSAGAFNNYRQMASVDGASAVGVVRHIILGMGWPILLAAGLLVTAMSLSEVPATALLTPPSLMPMLLGFVHQQRYAPMIEASLGLALVLCALGWAMTALVAVGRSRVLLRGSRGRRDGFFARLTSKRVESKSTTPLLLVILITGLAVGAVAGCDRRVDEPVAVWFRAGRGLGETVYPRGLARAPDGSLFVVDRAARIQHISSTGEPIGGWQMWEYAQGKPVGLTVADDGTLWVPDTHYHRIILFSPDGRELDRFGSEGTGPGEFDLPTDIAFDKHGNIYISEYGRNDRIQVFDSNRKFLRQIGGTGTGPGQFSRPQSMVIVDDLLYVTDSCNHRLSVFKTDGTFVKNFGQTGSKPGEYRFPYGLDLDSNGRLIVSEFGNNRVQMIERDTGASLATWGRPGRLPGELSYAWAVVALPDGRNVVADAGNNRLQVFRFR